MATTDGSAAAPFIDGDAVAELCRQHGVLRLSVFGSAVTDRFDPERSDVDFLVEFLPEKTGLRRAYFGLRDGLAALLGREVDLVMRDAVTNPYFARAAFGSARDVYAA